MHERKNSLKLPHNRPRRRAKNVATYWVFGTHAVHTVLMNPARRVERLLVTEGAGRSLPPSPAADVVRVETVPRRTIDSVLTPDAVHQGIAASVHPLPKRALADIEFAADAVVAVLDQAQDPRNTGAVLRSAAAFGVSAIILSERGSPDTGGTIAKAAAGALEAVPLVRETNLSRALKQLKDAGFWCVGLDGSAPVGIAEVDLAGRIALVIGGEGRGLRRLTRETCDTLARIPMAPGWDSLNLATAAAIAFYETRRHAP